ncbi:hypothetical protein CJ030_MR5G019114 [Morella rubra]|uniref:Uncharacterized protein n=1 Tax=Morella rubra TaxID=262757 RepID=A0A6A1VIB8_9ROSI|nr:hypothetical protein CJ030_MR5G019114 [Morella rubra]
MADKGQYEDFHRIIGKECAKVHNYIFSMDKQISELRMYLESTESEEALEALKDGIEPMEMTQVELKKFILHEGLKELFATEDRVRDCLKEWQMKFGFSYDPSEPSCRKGKEIFQEASKLEEEGNAHKSGLSPQSARPELEVYANIEASEQKMEELIRECKEGFKKDSDSVKKSLVELLKKCKLLEHEEVRALVAIYLQAVRVGNRLCCLLIDFLFMMSRQKNLAAKIERLTSALRCVAEDKNSIFIVQLFNALEIVAIEFKRMKITEVTRPSLKRNLEAMENPESSSNRKSTPEELSEQQFLEPILYQLLDQFVKVAADLESIVSHPSLPELQMPRKEALQC